MAVINGFNGKEEKNKYKSAKKLHKRSAGWFE